MLSCCFPLHRSAAEETKTEHLLKHPENNHHDPITHTCSRGTRHPVPPCTTAPQPYSPILFSPQRIKFSFTTGLLETQKLTDSKYILSHFKTKINSHKLSQLL